MASEPKQRNCPAHFGLRDLPCQEDCGSLCIRAEPKTINRLLEGLRSEVSYAEHKRSTLEEELALCNGTLDSRNRNLEAAHAKVAEAESDLGLEIGMRRAAERLQVMQYDDIDRLNRRIAELEGAAKGATPKAGHCLLAIASGSSCAVAGYCLNAGRPSSPAREETCMCGFPNSGFTKNGKAIHHPYCPNTPRDGGQSESNAGAMQIASKLERSAGPEPRNDADNTSVVGDGSGEAASAPAPDADCIFSVRAFVYPDRLDFTASANISNGWGVTKSAMERVSNELNRILSAIS